MSDDAKLETPDSPEDLYHSRGEDAAAFPHRPIFTGDVMRLADRRLVSAVQHPCAMRRGIEPLPKTLVCEVTGSASRPPVDWSAGHYKSMFLPDMSTVGDHVVDLTAMDLLSPAEIAESTREVILSEFGVNLLIQRWTYHNNRIVIPTRTINEQTAGPFEEADLVSESCDDLQALGFEPDDALRLVDAWLGRRDGAMSHRDRLNDAQARSTVRRLLRAQVEAWGRTRTAT